MIFLHLKSNFKKTLELYNFYLEKNLKSTEVDFKLVRLPKKIKRLTILKSTHVNKKARDQYEIRTYSLTLMFPNKTQNVTSLMKFLLSNKPALINAKITIK